MQFSKLFDDDRAVSPVIGVILMVAITVILAAVIGTFVLGLSDQVQDTTPRASFGWQNGDAPASAEATDDSNNDDLQFTFESGETIEAGNLEINGPSLSSAQTWHDAPGTSASAASDEVSAGASGWVIDASAGTYRIIYNNPSSDKTATLSKHEYSS